MMVTVWLHVALLPQSSTAFQVCVMTIGQVPFVTVLSTVMVTFPGWPAALTQGLAGVGWSKVQVLPHSTVLFEAQVSEKPQPVEGGFTRYIKVQD